MSAVSRERARLMDITSLSLHAIRRLTGPAHAEAAVARITSSRSAPGRSLQFCETPRSRFTAAVRLAVRTLGILDPHLDPLSKSRVVVPQLGTTRRDSGS